MRSFVVDKELSVQDDITAGGDLKANTMDIGNGTLMVNDDGGDGKQVEIQSDAHIVGM